MMSVQDRKTILIVEDDAFTANFTSRLIQKAGFNVISANTGEAALEIASSDEKINLILMDIELGSGIDGPETARRILEKRNLPIVFTTTHSEKEYVEKVKNINRYGYVLKNSGAFVLRSSIEMALELFEANMNLEKNMKELRESEEKIRNLLVEKEIASNISKNSLELLNSVLNSSSDGIIVMRPVEDENCKIVDYKCVFSNKVANFLLGYEGNALNGEPLGALIYHINEGGLFNMYSKTFKTGMPLYYDHSLMFNGEKSWFQFYAVKHREYIITVFTDVSYKKEAEKTLQEQLFLNEVILDSITDPMMLINGQKRILIFNKAAEMLGAADYKRCWELRCDKECFIKKEDIDANEGQFQILDVAISNNMAFDVKEIRMFEKIWHVHILPVYNDTYLFYATDITVYKDMEEKLKKTAEIADSANKIKGRFLAIMSHEIRTPMNSIIGFSDLLDRTELNFEQKEMLHYIRTSGRALLDLINDILDFSKIEANKIYIEKIEFNLIDVIYEVYSISKISAINKNIELTYSIDARQNYNLLGDPSRLRQIILNLTTNAIKFTEKGRVTINSELISDTDTDSLIKISIADSGIGIAADEQEKIFHPFVQADGTVTRKFGGTGLGLSISNELVKLMGGEKIFIESREGKGSTFYFIIKFKKCGIFSDKKTPAEDTVKTAKIDTSKRYKVLFAEDNETNIVLGLNLLQSSGFDVTVAENGKVAVEKASSDKFDIILMDVQMPVLDGLEATKQIRQLKIKTPIIAMTATAMKENKLDCINAGMDSFISKPLNIDQFINEIIKFINYGKESTENQKNIETSDASSEPAAEVKIIDIEKLKKNMGGKKDLIKDAISMFNEYHEKYMLEIHKAVSDRDSKKLKFSAHKLKGTALMAGAMRVANILSALEKMGEDDTLETSADLFKSVEAEIDAFKKEIQTIQL